MKRKSQRHKGVYQRCRDDCPDDRCSRHRWSWELELPGPNGKRDRRFGSGYASAKAAAEARAEVARKHRDGVLPSNDKTTVGAWLDKWLRDRQNDPDSPLRPTTAVAYRQHVDAYWKPKLGHRRLTELRRDHVSAALAEIVADREREIAEAERRNAALFARNPTSTIRPARVPKPFAKSTLVRIRAALSSALGDAVDAGLIAANPAANVRLRKGKRRAPAERTAPKAWSAEDTARFLDAVATEDHPLAGMWHLAALHGLRRGELCGLRWPSIDLEAGTLRVEHTRTTAGYEVVEGDPKSEHSKGTVDLDTATVTLLRAWKTRQARDRLALGEAWRAGDLVFARPDGLPWHPDSVSKQFERAVAKHGLPRITLHGLRHTAVSLAIRSGVGIEVASKRARHANSTITSQVYSHLVGDAGKQAADAVASLIAQHRAGGAGR